MSDSQTHAAFQAPDIADLAPLFPGYEIENLIATGGMGAVYRAIQKSLDRTVAIKILPQEFSKDAAFCAGFEAEAKAMARLNHPNLIGVYDFGEVNGMLFIIMEYVAGKSVFHSAHGIAIDPGEVIRLVTGICNGLSHAHENGIIHRDIKPSNILLDLNAQPKIGDFGLARPIGTKVQDGEEIFGTPHYTAPEVVNSPQSVGYRADIFSVGVMLHELLTGRLPAEDTRPASAIVLCDPRFDAIIRRATNTLPELRYSSAAEIAKDLQIIAASSGPKVARTSPALKGPPRPVSGPGRPRARAVVATKSSSPVPGIVMFVIAIVVGISAYIYYTSHLAQPPPPPLEVTSPQPPKDMPKNPGHPEAKPTTIPDSKPWIDPTPKPNPEPGTIQEPKTEPKAPSDPTPVPDAGNPDLGQADATIPRFDVPGFFERARKLMQERAAPLIASHNASIGKNLDDFERAIKRLIRKLDFGKVRDNAEIDLATYMEPCRANGNRIPPKPEPDPKKKKETRSIQNFGDFAGIHDEFFNKQTALEGQMMQSLAALSPTYILWLENQIQRLKADNDTAAITLIEAEIEKTRSNPEYFPDLMLGIDPAQKNTEKKPKTE